MPDNTIPSELFAAMREIIRYAIMTLAAQRDPDARYLGLSQMPVHVVHDLQEAYGYSSASVRKFKPTPHDIDQMWVVMPWLVWIRKFEGDLACRRLIGWAMGAPLWRLGQREHCSDRTIMNRIDRSIAAIIHQFANVNIPVEKIDEPYKGTHYAIVHERPEGPHGQVVIKKVYVGGLGYMKNGKRVSDSTAKFDLARMTA